MLKKRKLPEGVVEQMQDRQLRVVTLTEKTMGHIAERRPEMDGCEMAIKAAVEAARDRCHGRKNGERVGNREILFAPNIGDGPWLAVVVAYEGDQGTVITAYADRRGPKEADRL